MSPEQRAKVGREVERKLEEFYDALDRLAPQDVQSPEWLGFVEGLIGFGGAMEGYEEWVQETWEPLEAVAA